MPRGFAASHVLLAPPNCVSAPVFSLLSLFRSPTTTTTSTSPSTQLAALLLCLHIATARSNTLWGAPAGPSSPPPLEPLCSVSLSPNGRSTLRSSSASLSPASPSHLHLFVPSHRVCALHLHCLSLSFFYYYYWSVRFPYPLPGDWSLFL